jgi:hypothetical protein
MNQTQVDETYQNGSYIESNMIDDYEEDKYDDFYLYQPIADKKDKQFKLLLKFSIVNLITFLFPLILIIVIRIKLVSFKFLYQNMNHILNPFVIIVTILFFIFTISGVVVGKFFKLNSWLLFIPFVVFFFLTATFYLG